MKALPDGRREDDFRNRQKFLPVLQYVRDRVTAATSVRELAAMMKLRPESFCREFSRALGQSPKTFLQRELAMKAVGLLAQRECRVKVAAELLGFASEFYFSKFFKRRIGVSPGAYRNGMTTGQ